MPLVNIPGISISSPSSPPATAEYHYSMDNEPNDDPGQGAASGFQSSRSITTLRADGTWNPSNNTYFRCTLSDGVEDSSTGFVFNDFTQASFVDEYHIGMVLRFGSNFTPVADASPFTKFMVGLLGVVGGGQVHNESPMLEFIEAGTSGEFVPVGTSQPGGTYRCNEYNTNAYDSNGDTGARFYDTAANPGAFSYQYRPEQESDWVYIVFSHYKAANPDYDGVRLSFYSRDGTISARDAIETRSLATASYGLDEVRFLYNVGALSGCTVNTYFDLSDIYIDPAFIGPPPGFLT